MADIAYGHGARSWQLLAAGSSGFVLCSGLGNLVLSSDSLVCAGALGSPNKALCGTSNTEWRFAGGWHCQRLRQPSWCCWAPVPKAQAAFGSMPGGSTTGAPDWRDAAKLRKFLADDIPQWTPSEGAENTRAFLAALREKCSTEIGAMTGLLLALFEERVDASKAGYELAQKLKRGGGGATPREELDMEMLFGDTKDFESAASAGAVPVCGVGIYLSAVRQRG